MKTLIAGGLLILTMSSFAQTTVKKNKIYQCVLETAGTIEKATTLYSGTYEPVREDYISTNKTRIAAVTDLKNRCLSDSDTYTIRLVGTNTPAIDYNDYSKLFQNNLKVCKELLSKNMKCEISEETEEVSE